MAIWHLPEHITHLYYSPVYATLSLDQKLSYNRLHACYHCELCAFLEGELPVVEHLVKECPELLPRKAELFGRHAVSGWKPAISSKRLFT